MKYLSTILLLAVLIPATSFAVSNFMGGNELLARCSNEGTKDVDYMDRSQCRGYIQGIADAHDRYAVWEDMQPNFCIPKNVNTGQLQKIVVKSLNDHPEGLHYAASSRVSNALHDAFPPSYKDDGPRYCPDQGES